MGRKPINEDDLKANLTIRIKSSLITKLRSIDNYNSLIEQLLENYLKDNVEK